MPSASMLVVALPLSAVIHGTVHVAAVGAMAWHAHSSWGCNLQVGQHVTGVPPDTNHEWQEDGYATPFLFLEPHTDSSCKYQHVAARNQHQHQDGEHRRQVNATSLTSHLIETFLYSSVSVVVESSNALRLWESPRSYHAIQRLLSSRK
jgi:hypothetical protein